MAAMQGVALPIGSNLGLSVLPKDTTTDQEPFGPSLATVAVMSVRIKDVLGSFYCMLLPCKEDTANSISFTVDLPHI